MKLEALMVRTNPEETEGNVQEVVQALGVAEYRAEYGVPYFSPTIMMAPFGEDGWVLPGTVPNAQGLILYFQQHFD